MELSPAFLQPATRDSFLAGLYSFRAANLTELDVLSPGSSGPILAASETYDNTIDPFSLREDLDEFKDIVCATKPPAATVEVLKEMYRAPTDPVSNAACNGGTFPDQNEFFHVGCS